MATQVPGAWRWMGCVVPAGELLRPAEGRQHLLAFQLVSCVEVEWVWARKPDRGAREMAYSAGGACLTSRRGLSCKLGLLTPCIVVWPVDRAHGQSRERFTHGHEHRSRWGSQDTAVFAPQGNSCRAARGSWKAEPPRAGTCPPTGVHGTLTASRRKDSVRLADMSEGVHSGAACWGARGT